MESGANRLALLKFSLRIRLCKENDWVGGAHCAPPPADLFPDALVAYEQSERRLDLAGVRDTLEDIADMPRGR
jgi:hypothetical protein